MVLSVYLQNFLHKSRNGGFVNTTSKIGKDVADLKALQCIMCFDLLGTALRCVRFGDLQTLKSYTRKKIYK